MKVRTSLLIILICLLVSIPIGRYLDRYHPAEESIEQVLYLPSGKIVKNMSFGFDGLLADIYWLRSVQYFGRQLLNEKQEVDWSQMAHMRYDLLYPLLDITTTLDPHYIAAYRFGAIFLPDHDPQQALKLLNKGIENNPDNWRLYQNLGTLYWQVKDYKAASEAFFKGSQLPNAPIWMKVLGGVMLSQGGSRATACKLYNSLYEEALNANDDLIRAQMEMQINRIYALDEVDYLNRVLKVFKEKTGRCPASLVELRPILRQNSGVTGTCEQPIRIKLNQKGEPVSPINGMLYLYDPQRCEAKMPFELGFD